MSKQTPDASIRHQALNPMQSFIVQAPAGSGKTELLTQRFLTLLARSEAEPESVLAFTFTRKAAAEMRMRVLDALKCAENPEPEEAHKRQTWRLAKAVLEQDAARDWQLLAHPSRLNITTIDGFCAKLNRQLPMASQLGPGVQVTEQAYPLYEAAAQQLLADLENPEHAWQPALLCLFAHLDNRFDVLERLLVELLARREQWMALVGQEEAQFGFSQLKRNLEAVVQHAVASTQQLLSQDHRETLQRLLSYAQQHMDTALPADLASQDPIMWQHFANWLLTQSGEWRKSVNKRQGFPAATHFDQPEAADEAKAMKSTMQVLLGQLMDTEGLHQALRLLQILPVQGYAERHQSVLEALYACLPILVAYLRLAFADRQQIDFNEVMLSALTALDSLEGPSDLALRLDYHIQHVLVDEFQDTSEAQFRLLYALTQAWQPGDGRTLFLVGDPMQSIYRFRQAEVGLFLEATKGWLGHVPLTYLQLSANFRSHPGVVDWNNHVFAEVFPNTADSLRGGVPYHPAVSMMPGDGGVNIYCSDESACLLQKVVETIQVELRRNPKSHIAILVRSRRHLLEVLPVLKQNHIPFQAVELESLWDYPLTQDLLSLTYALTQLADRLSWLALLRSPLCGLMLTDIHELAMATLDCTVWEALQDVHVQLCLSPDGQQRTAWFVSVLKPFLQQLGRLRVEALIWQVYRALKGPQLFPSQDEQQIFDTFMAALQDAQTVNVLLDRAKFETQLSACKIRSSHAEASVEVMTIHKSKGLEFDCVILPECQRSARRDSAPMLLWQEYPCEAELPKLLMAPIKPYGAPEDPVYRFLAAIEADKSQYELQRLFYVAATRAKSQLVLLAQLQKADDGFIAPPKRSLLGVIWPHIADQLPQFWVENSKGVPEISHTVAHSKPVKRRPLTACAVANSAEPLPVNLERVVTLQDDAEARNLGTLVHFGLAVIAKQKLNSETLLTVEPLLRRQGAQLGYGEALTTASMTMLSSVLLDTKGQWILQAHPVELTEQAFVEVRQGRAQQWVIDRCFIDAEGVGWIIDYKTSTPISGQSLEDFYDEQLLMYEPQLNAYQRVMAQHFPKVRQWNRALYFCALSAEHENARFIQYSERALECTKFSKVMS